jgi:hypothetical protein
LGQADEDTLVRVRNFCSAVLRAREAMMDELAGIVCRKARDLRVTGRDLEKVSNLMFAVADEMRKRRWQ